MNKAILAILIIFLANFASANDIAIVDVRRNIPLSDEEPAYKDFYINAGSDDGLKKNLVVTVVRPTNIRDASGAQSFGEIQIPVGQVRILAVYQKLSVAREYKLLPREENPMLEQTAIMNGDKLDLKNSFVDNKPARKPQTVAENRETVAVPVPIVAALMAAPPPAALPQAVISTAPTAPVAAAPKTPEAPVVAQAPAVEARKPEPIQTEAPPTEHPVNNTAGPESLHDETVANE